MPGAEPAMDTLLTMPTALPAGPRRGRRPVGRPVSVDGNETRSRILHEARTCFATLGYAATSNRIIAERAGLSTSALHHHFGRKNDLMLAVHRATYTENYRRLRAAIDGVDGFRTKVQALLDAVQETINEDPAQAVFAFVARDEARRHPELREIAEDTLYPRLFAELVEGAVAAGELRAEDALPMRGALAVMLVGLASVAGDMSASAYAVATEGCKRLMAGTLP